MKQINRSTKGDLPKTYDRKKETMNNTISEAYPKLYKNSLFSAEFGTWFHQDKHEYQQQCPK